MNKSIKKIFKLILPIKKPSHHELDFDEIYENNLFKSNESRSGQGSEVQHTSVLRNKLVPLLEKFNVKKFLDVPCGDFNWMRLVKFGDIEYIGGDIVRDLVKKNQNEFSNPRCNFLYIDVTSSKLPQADVIFCRDCFVHLNYEQIFNALKNIKNNNIKYLMATTYTNQQENKDLLEGIWRPLNFQKSPFNFPKPIELINEEYFENNGKWADRCMGMWKVDDLKLN